MEVTAIAIVVVIVAAIAVLAVILRGRSRTRPAAAVNYLIPGKHDEPLTPREVYAAGIDHVGLCGDHRQELIAKLRKGEPIYLVRMPDHPYDRNAVALYRADGKDIGFLPRETAAEIAPRLDRGSPVTATVSYVEPFETEEGRKVLGVHLWLVPHRLKRR